MYTRKKKVSENKDERHSSGRSERVAEECYEAMNRIFNYVR